MVKTELVVQFILPLIAQTIPIDIVAIRAISQIIQLLEVAKKRFRANIIIAPTPSTTQIVNT